MPASQPACDVVREVLRQRAAKARRVHHDDVIEALASGRADDGCEPRALRSPSVTD